MEKAPLFRKLLTRWYLESKRDLPWRRTSDPYAILVSEIMLQQTRVTAAIPFYERFLQRFPTYQSLAAAPTEEVLTAWAGLGYYYRARNLQKAAQKMVELGGFPQTHEGILELPGVGAYTAAAVGSIAFGLPHAVVDGNVLRVLSRIEKDAADIGTPRGKQHFQIIADQLLDHEHPGDYNQAVMELGATICLPRGPQCLLCPVATVCDARAAGVQEQYPIKAAKKKYLELQRRLLLIQRKGQLLFHQRPADSSLMPGFYELPEAAALPEAEVGEVLGSVKHTITHHHYTFEVYRATIDGVPDGYHWIGPEQRRNLPLSTVAKKALSRLRVEP